MEKQFTKDQKYLLASKRVEKIGKFYKHFAIYVVVNIFLTSIFIIGHINNGATFYESFTNYNNYKIWFFWGIAIFFQALNTFGIPLFFNKNWEENKIKEYMKKDKI